MGLTPVLSSLLQGCSSPLVVKFADTQRDKEQRRLQQQLVQQIQQLNNTSTWGNLAGLSALTPQYLAVSVNQTRRTILNRHQGRCGYRDAHVKTHFLQMQSCFSFTNQGMQKHYCYDY